MTLEIPNERQDEREEHLHEEEKAKHIKDRRGEYYQERREDLSHDADRYDRTLRDEIHFAERVNDANRMLPIPKSKRP